MYYKNARIFCSDFTFRTGAFEVKDGRFGRVLAETVPEDAIRAASYTPACAIGADEVVGSIETGKVADFLVCSADYASRRVFMAEQER